MSTATIVPSTVDGIKQLATKIKRERLISHSHALEAASRQAGFESFVHARRSLPARNARNAHIVYLSAHWSEPRDRSTSGASSRRQAGRELLQVALSKPLLGVVAKHRVSIARGLRAFAMEYSDHLECRSLAQSQEQAREWLVRAERSLRFMEATGLQPISTEGNMEKLGALDQLPGSDHQSWWFDPVSNAVALLDEPYPGRIERRGEERRSILIRNGFTEMKLDWDGLHNPGHTVQLLVSRDEPLLNRVGQQVRALKRYSLPDPWLQETGLVNDAFVSPERAASGVRRKPIPNASYGSRAGAVPYGGGFGLRSRWRPAQPMSVDHHMELGGLLAQIDVEGVPYKIYRDLMVHFRSELEEWANREHLSGAVGFTAYYDQQHLQRFRSRERTMKALLQAKKIVENGYNDCIPRRELLSAIEAYAGAASKTP